jgi:hypothetical protein
MTDRIGEFAKKGQWDKYKKAVKKEWEAYVEEQKVELNDSPIDMDPELVVMLANKLPIELWIEPNLWQAALDKAGDDRQLKAIIRALLREWVNGGVSL